MKEQRPSDFFAGGVKARRFMFATGIENSYPTIALPNGETLRVDEMAKCYHYERWREDFQLVKDLGIEFLRYGPPYYKMHTGPGRYDWTFADETFAALKDLGITPIADLCHFGVPDWVGNFQNPDWPTHFEEYARAFAERFPWVHLFTPVNEISVAARFSALYGWWNERLKSDEAYVTALKHLCQANVLAMRAILEVQPEATFIQSESSEYYHAEDPDCQPEAATLNQRRFLALDLTYGYPINVQMYEYLLDHGMTREEYHWFGEHHVKARCIMGNDYYATNEHMVHGDGSTTAPGEIFGYYVITHQYYRRYGLAGDAHGDEPEGRGRRAAVVAQRVVEHAPAEVGRRAHLGLHVVQPDGSGGLGHGAQRRQGARQSARTI